MRVPQYRITEYQWDLTSIFKLFLLMITILSIKSVNALDIGEKLTIRILKTSSSRKTILINRGLEDGVVVGDHAKFFLTDGIIARGLVIKASPSRSVWSLYRILRLEELSAQQVMNIKAVSPVRVTSDPTKSLNAAPIVTGREVMLERKDGKIDLRDRESVNDRKEMRYLRGHEVVAHSKYKGTVDESLDWEVVGMMATQSLTVTNTTANGESADGGKYSSLVMTAGLEKYFPHLNNALGRRFSFLVFVNKTSTSDSSTSIESSISSMDFGIGSFYHFLNLPYAVGKISMYAGGTMGLGSEKLTVTTSTATTESTATANFFSAVLGAKYLLRSGFSFRLGLEFIRRGITYKNETTSQVESTQTQSGLRMMAGVSFRW